MHEYKIYAVTRERISIPIHEKTNPLLILPKIRVKFHTMQNFIFVYVILRKAFVFSAASLIKHFVIFSQSNHKILLLH